MIMGCPALFFNSIKKNNHNLPGLPGARTVSDDHHKISNIPPSPYRFSERGRLSHDVSAAMLKIGIDNIAEDSYLCFLPENTTGVIKLTRWN
jgi:hypothetical protein